MSEIPMNPSSGEKIRELAELGEPCQYETDEVIFEAGDDGDCMYLIATGQVELRFPDDRNPKLLGPGEFFGELSLLFGSHRRTAAAVVKGPSQLKRLDQSTFDELRATRPAQLIEVLRETCATLLDAERQLVERLVTRNSDLEQALHRLDSAESRLENAEIAALTDPLTGLFNRRAFDYQVARFLSNSESAARGMSLLLLDIDHFKQHNDTFGHAAGDKLLRDLSSCVRSSLRKSDLPYRIGGDEFAILLFDIAPFKAVERARELLESLHARRDDDGADQEGKPGFSGATVSLGGASLEPQDDAKGFFERADQNLYLAKRDGRCRLAWGGEVILSLG